MFAKMVYTRNGESFARKWKGRETNVTGTHGCLLVLALLPVTLPTCPESTKLTAICLLPISDRPDQRPATSDEHSTATATPCTGIRRDSSLRPLDTIVVLFPAISAFVIYICAPNSVKASCIVVVPHLESTTATSGAPTSLNRRVCHEIITALLC